MGKKFSAAIGIYVVVKAVFNGIIGAFSLPEIVLAVAVLGFLLSGIKFINYVVAILLAFVVAKNFGNNISDIANNWIYLIEAALDIGAAAILVFNKDVKEFFSAGIPKK